MSPENTHDVFVFGDLACAFQEELRQLLHLKTNPNLQAFFQLVAAALRKELANLPMGQRQWIPGFTTLIDLVSAFETSTASPAIKSALLTIYQVGRFICYHSDGGKQLPSADSAFIFASCTGSFAAAAVSASSTIAELIAAGTEATIVSFRTGLCSLIHGFDIQGSTETSSSWSLAVGLPLEEVSPVLASYCTVKAEQLASRPYISAVSPSSVTISGEPKQLQDLVRFASFKSVPLPIHSPYHAPHLFSRNEASDIVGSQGSGLQELKSRIPVVLPVSGELLPQSSFREALVAAVEHTTCDQLRLDNLSSSLVAGNVNRPATSCYRVWPVGASNTAMICSALKRWSDTEIDIKDGMTGVPARDSSSSSQFADSIIAIIGFSGRYPEADSNEEFWDLLRAGRDVHRTIPEDRFDWQAHFDATGKKKNTSRIKHGCFIKQPGLMDARFFNISPREAENADPAQRLALMATYEALEMAGFVPNETPSTQQDRVGVFFGITSDDWREVNSGQDVDTYFIPGGNRAFLPGRISYFFRFSGPSISMDTACSSSFAAIQTACSYLWRGECDTAIAGGANVLTNPDNFAGLDRGHFLSTTGNCNPFDDNADGYCRADGVGSVILKRLEDAQVDGDPIFAVIAGSKTNHCGQTDSITRPFEGDQVAVFRSILRNANVDPHSVSYVEMHGTGTQAGDATEMSSVLSVFDAKQNRTTQQPLYLGSSKANIGHSEAASGVSSLVKVLLMLRNDEIPPHCGIKTKINHHYPLDLEERNIHIAKKPTRWPRHGTRTVFVNNFSAAGGNTALLLQDPPEQGPLLDSPVIDSRETVPVCISAKSQASAKGIAQSLEKFLSANPDTSLSGLSYTLNARRSHYSHRVCFTAATISNLHDQLQQWRKDGSEAAFVAPKRAYKVAFVFTGQGALYAALGKELFDTIDTFRADLLRYNSIACSMGFPDFLSIVDGSATIPHSADTITIQLALCCVQMALLRLWQSWGVEPAVVTGHSLGEYAALFAAGVLSASDTIWLVGKRAELISSFCKIGTHSMLAVKASLSEITPLLDGSVHDVACINGPRSTVISGPNLATQALKERLKSSKNVESSTLEIPYAFHSAQVDPIVEEFVKIAASIEFKKPRVPYLSPLRGSTIHEAGLLNGKYLGEAARETVDFMAAIEAAVDDEVVNQRTLWLEIGSHPWCSRMVKDIVGPETATLGSLRRGTSAWTSLGQSLQTLYMHGINIAWGEYHRPFASCQKVLTLPRYSWDLSNYWIQYRNNFCLTKGEVSGRPAPEAQEMAPFLSSSIHQIIEESVGHESSTILIQSNLGDPRLRPIVHGHKVNGVSLCPSSLYADMAITIADHLARGRHEEPSTYDIDCAEMLIEKPLVALGDGSPQYLRVLATANWTNDTVTMRFFSVNGKSETLADHAKCVTKIRSNQEGIEGWYRTAYLVNGRVTALEKAAGEISTCHRLKRAMVYKLFGSFVEYDETYRGMDEVVIDTEEREAIARVSLKVGDRGFLFDPCWIDSLGHIAGFIMNNGVEAKDSGLVYVNHGWQSARFARPLACNRVYTTYNKMHLVGGNTYVGDTYVLEEGAIVGVIQGVKFQGVPRSVLDTLLPNVTIRAEAAQKPLNNASSTRPTALAPSKEAPSIRQPHVKPETGGLSSQVAAIIAEEARITTKDLDYDADFADLGIDSLLTLTITARLQEELGFQVASSAFSDFPTLGAFTENLIGSGSSSSSTSIDTGSVLATPESVTTTATDIHLVGDQIDIMDVLRSSISRETGLPLRELTPSLCLRDVGVDSLLALNVMATLSEQLGQQLPPTLLADNDTLEQIEDTLGMNGYIKTTKSSPPASKSVMAESNHVPSTHPCATSVLLQGSAKTAEMTLFMFPDGAGSAVSYASLPAVSSKVVIYGLNCPWLRTPHEMNCDFEQYVAIYLEEIRRRQPTGPYHFGGWSAGGIMAYEAAQQLAAAGEQVQHLILLDSPNPVGLENPPPRMYDFFESLDFFGMAGKSPPSWLRPHFDAFLAILDKYRVVPFRRRSVPVPAVHIIYAKDGICKNDDDPRPEIRLDDPREMLWLLNNRTDFTGAGWKDLLGKDHVSTTVLENVNHFTMVAPGPHAARLANWIAKSLLG